MPCVRVHLIDPSGDVLPYDHALAAALARRGLDVELVTDMLRYRRHAAAADVRHFQWLPIERIDSLLLPAARPRVLTMHNVIRREAVDARLAGRMDAVIVHTRHGAELLAGAN